MRPDQRNRRPFTYALLFAIVATAIHGTDSAAQDTATTPDKAREGIKLYRLDDDGLALQGYSPVSYFDKKTAEKGNPEFAVTHQGITYHLTDTAQVEKFNADPDKYEPAHGGWCSLAMCGKAGNRVSANPESFKIVDDKLLLFFHGQYQGRIVDGLDNWNKSRSKEEVRVRRADSNWKKITSGKKRSKVMNF